MPSEAAAEIRQLYVPVKKVQQHYTFAGLHSFDRCGEGRIDKQALAAALRMSANDWMLRRQDLRCLSSADVIGLVLIARKGARGVVNRHQVREHPLHFVR